MARSNLEIINELDKTGELQQLIRAGLMPCKVKLHRDLYCYVDARKQGGSSMKEIVIDVEDKFRIRRSALYGIVKGFGR